MAIFKLSNNYIQMISLQNVMEKIIIESITLFLFNILKLLCSIFCTLFNFRTSTSAFNCVVSRI